MENKEYYGNLDRLKELAREHSGLTAPTVSTQRDTVTVYKRCAVKSTVYSVQMSVFDYEKWQNGGFLQALCPYLSFDEREFLISGMTPAEYNSLFSQP